MSPALLSGIAVALLAWGIYEERQAPRRRIARMLQRAVAPVDLDAEEGAVRRAAQWLIRRLRHWLPSSQIEQLRDQLLWAGQPLQLTPDEFLFAKVAAAGLGALMVWLVGVAGRSGNAGMLALGAAVGYLIPQRLLKLRIEERARLIRIDLPGFVHLLATAIEAGLPITEAVRRVAAEAPGLLSAEMLRTVQEIAAGKPTVQAWQHLAGRTNCGELREVVGAILQSQEYGVGVAEQLRFQMRAMRTQKQQRASERAQAASVQMKIPTILLIVAPTMIIILGPVFMALVAALGGG